MSSNNKPYTIDEVREIFLNHGYTLLEQKYKNTREKMEYVCNKHKDMGIQYTSLGNLIDPRKSGRTCKWCLKEDGRPNRRFSEEKAKILCEERNFEYVGINFRQDEDGKFRSYIQFICNKHRDKGIQEVISYSLKNHKQCKYCAGFEKTTDDLRKSVKNPNIEILGEYKGAFEKIECKCKIHDLIWYTTPDSLIQGRGCPACKVNTIKEKQTRTTEEYVKLLSEKNPNLELLEPYKTANEKLLFRCKLHNYEWMAVPQKLITFQTGCPKCQSYNNENRLYNILTS